MKINEINVIAIYVTDLERAKVFYSSTLGFEVSSEMSPGLLLTSNEISIYLEPGRMAKSDSPLKCCEVSPCFSTDSIKASYEELKKTGVKIVSEYVEYGPEFAMFKFADPDNNVIELAGKP